MHRQTPTTRKRRRCRPVLEAPVKRDEEPETYVWAYVSLGKTRRMLREEAEREGYEIDERPGVGVEGYGLHGVRREFITQEERREIFHKTGVMCDDRDDLRKAMKSKGLREAEKGESCHEMFDALKDHADTGGQLDSRYKLENIDLFGVESKRKKFNMHEAYLKNCQRLGVKPNW